MADAAGPDPAAIAGWRPLAVAALAVVPAALGGELRAPAPVLPTAVTLGLVVVVVAGLIVLVSATGVRALVAGRALRAAALAPIALAAFLVPGPRFRLIVLMLWGLVVVIDVVVVITAVATLSARGRDSATAAVAVVVATIGGWYAAGAVEEARLAVHADRYRSEAAAFLARPDTDDTVFPGQDLDEPFLAGRDLARADEPLEPVAVAWLWDPGEDGPASSWGVLYAPEGAPTADGSPGGYVRRCTAAVVDGFYWCSFT